MSDIFISYAREDREVAQRLATVLGASGWSVWWDRKIIAGQSFDQAIERELEGAKSVVVLWSPQSIASEWVKNEATVAAERGVLVPAMIDSVRLPLEFRRRQTADLRDWKGEASHDGFHALCEGIASAMGGPSPQPAMPPQAEKWWWRRQRWLVAVAIAVVLGISLTAPWRGTTPIPPAQSLRSETGTAPESAKASAAGADPADLVVGIYYGDVISDSKGGARSDVGVTITRLDRTTVRVTSDYSRLGTVDVTLTRSGHQIIATGGDTPLIVDLERNPPALLFNPRNEVAYAGIKQK